MYTGELKKVALVPSDRATIDAGKTAQHSTVHLSLAQANELAEFENCFLVHAARSTYMLFSLLRIPWRI